MIIFEIWIIMVINEFLCILFTYFYSISGDNNLGRVILVQNLTTWVKWPLSLMYNRLSLFAYTQKNDALWKINDNVYWNTLILSLIVSLNARNNYLSQKDKCNGSSQERIGQKLSSPTLTPLMVSYLCTSDNQ